MEGGGKGEGGRGGGTTARKAPAFAPLTVMLPGAESGPGSSPPPVQPGQSATKSPLTWRIFLAAAGLVVAVLAITLIVTYASAERVARVTIGSALDATAKHINGVMDREGRELQEKTRLYLLNPDIRTTIASPKDSGDYLDQAENIALEAGATWAQVIDSTGTRLAKSDEPAADRVDLSASPLVERPLRDGENVRGFGITGGTNLFIAVGVPVLTAAIQPVPIAVVMAARNMTDSIAQSIREETGSEIVFVIFDSANTVKIAAASSGVTDRTGAAAALEPMLFDTPRSDSTGAIAMRLGRISGNDFFWSMLPLRTASGREIGGVIALRDKQSVLAPFRQMQLGIAGAGIVALVLAFALSLLIARQITRPVRALAFATQRAAEGDYAAEIPEAGKDEIGTLAAAFKRLLGDLREKQALVDFLQNPSAGMTVPVRAVTPTMQAAVMGGTDMMLEPGRRLANRYEIQSVLGAGGMGVVYKAADKELGDIVAIKTLKPDLVHQDPDALNRFRSEIRLARLISHRNVVRTHDIGESGGLYYITMEFVEGKSLKDLILARGRLPTAAVLPIAKQLCRALEVAHEAGVIHRDIKPQNMVVEGDGVLKVMDFGIARLAKQRSGGGLTQAGMVVGTPEYMAPEQLLGETIDARADLYAAGVVMYESLTGQLPHIADTPVTLIAKVLDEVPRPPRALAADIPPALSDLVMRTLSKNPDDRPKSAAELLSLLERI